MNHDDSIRIATGIALGYITGHYISLPHASAVEHCVHRLSCEWRWSAEWASGVDSVCS